MLGVESATDNGRLTTDYGLLISSFNFQSIIFDHWIAQEFVTRFVELLAGSFTLAAQFNFQIFPHMHGADALISHVGKSVLDCFALGIEDSFLWSNNNLRFHGRRVAP